MWSLLHPPQGTVLSSCVREYLLASATALGLQDPGAPGQPDRQRTTLAIHILTLRTEYHARVPRLHDPHGQPLCKNPMRQRHRLSGHNRRPLTGEPREGVPAGDEARGGVRKASPARVVPEAVSASEHLLLHVPGSPDHPSEGTMS